MSTLHWFKSSYSDDGGGQCVEIAYRCGERSRGSGDVTACACAAVHVRDSKDTGRGVLGFPSAAWSAFLAGVVTG